MNFKTILVVLMLTVLTACTAITTQSIPVDKIVKVENTEKNTLFVRANNWMVDNFRDAKSVVQFSDKESGSISGRYLLGTIVAADQYGPSRYAYATIKIQVKDNATKITVKPESFIYAKGNMFTLYTEKEVKEDVQDLLVSFEKAMQKTDNSDW